MFWLTHLISFWYLILTTSGQSWTSLNHLKNVLSCVNQWYHLPFRLHSNTWKTTSLTHCPVNRENTPLDGLLRSGKRLWYWSTAARALPLQNPYTKLMSIYLTWENTKGLCFITEISNTELFENFILVHFPTTDKWRKTSL